MPARWQDPLAVKSVDHCFRFPYISRHVDGLVSDHLAFIRKEFSAAIAIAHIVALNMIPKPGSAFTDSAKKIVIKRGRFKLAEECVLRPPTCAYPASVLIVH